MQTTYDVRIWKIDVYNGKTTTAYTVLWRVGTRRWKKRFKTKALADSYRADLLSAARRGEAFDLHTGQPVSAARPTQSITWLDFACDYIDMKWPRAAATYRRSLSEALTAITPAMLDGRLDGRGVSDLRCNWSVAPGVSRGRTTNDRHDRAHAAGSD
ncbi:hypothetical protein ACFQV8_28950 [Pseudonocardia benzenivorans]